MEEKIKNYLLENDETLKDVVQEINSWDGSLDYLDYWENDEDFFNTYFEDKPMDAVRAVYYGDYNYGDELVHFNAYGNLESTSEYQYYEELKTYIDEIVDRLIEEKDNVYIYDEELKKILNEEDEEDED